jgi:hypothetical protein
MRFSLLEIEHEKCKSGKLETKIKKPGEIEIRSKLFNKS